MSHESGISENLGHGFGLGLDEIFRTSNTDSYTDTSSDMGMSETLEYGLGYGQTSDMRVRPSLVRISYFSVAIDNVTLAHPSK